MFIQCIITYGDTWVYKCYVTAGNLANGTPKTSRNQYKHIPAEGYRKYMENCEPVFKTVRLWVSDWPEFGLNMFLSNKFLFRGIPRCFTSFNWEMVVSLSLTSEFVPFFNMKVTWLYFGSLSLVLQRGNHCSKSFRFVQHWDWNLRKKSPYCWL